MAPAIPDASVSLNAFEVVPEEEEELTLLKPFQLGPFSLSHRVIMAPLTRMRSYGGLPQAHAALYYSQRATPGGLIISEGTFVSEGARGYPGCPGIWTEEQVEAWKPIVKAVHDKGGIFFNQLGHGGRHSHTSYQLNGAKPVSSTSKPINSGGILTLDFSPAPYSEPRALETNEIPGVINDFVQAAKNARRAGFDGVEIHGGFLLNQFMMDGVNDRTDKYGGSLENRARFVLELVDATVDAVGADRVGIRLLPFTTDMDASDSDPQALGVYMATELSHRKLLWIEFVEPRWNVGSDGETLLDHDSMWAFRKAYTGGAFFAAGGYTRGTGNDAVKEGRLDAVIYGRQFIANPDLVRRFKMNAPLNKYDRSTFYTQDPVVGYSDYPSLEESHPEVLQDAMSKLTRSRISAVVDDKVEILASSFKALG